MNGIQHPIHEGSGLFGRKLLCQFNGLVEHDFGGSSGGTHFMNRQAQDGAVDGRKPFQPPVFAVLADDFIERSSIFGGAFEELVREFARFVGAFGALPKLCFQFRGILLAHVPLKEHLHRKLDRKSTRLNSSHVAISYAVFCLLLRPPSSLLFPYTTLFRSQFSQCLPMISSSAPASLAAPSKSWFANSRVLSAPLALFQNFASNFAGSCWLMSH